MDKTFRGSDEFAEAEVVQGEMQYMYRDGKALHFMDLKNCEEHSVDPNLIENVGLLKEGSYIHFVCVFRFVFALAFPTFVCTLCCECFVM